MLLGLTLYSNRNIQETTGWTKNKSWTPTIHELYKGVISPKMFSLLSQQVSHLGNVVQRWLKKSLLQKKSFTPVSIMKQRSHVAQNSTILLCSWRITASDMGKSGPKDKSLIWGLHWKGWGFEARTRNDSSKGGNYKFTKCKYLVDACSVMVWKTLMKGIIIHGTNNTNNEALHVPTWNIVAKETALFKTFSMFFKSVSHIDPVSH